MEPFYIAQTAEPHVAGGRMVWFEERAAEAKAQGAQLCRFTVHPDNPDLLLVEGWREKHVPDRGDPRWQLTAA